MAGPDVPATGWRRLGEALGLTHQGNRDVRKQLGRKGDISPAEYWFRYRRVPLARGVARFMPTWTWRGDNAFLLNDAQNATLDGLAENFDLGPTLFRVDLLADITGYAGVVLGGDAGAMKDELSGPATSLEVYGANTLTFKTDSDGVVTGYQLARNGLAAIDIHPSRVIHWADSDEGNAFFGTPTLECVWDILDDVEKAWGSYGESVWQNAVPDVQVNKNLAADTVATPETLKELDEDLSKWQHQLARVVRTLGDTQIKKIGGEVVSGIGDGIDTAIKLICATKLWPKRVFEGSERGELSSAQDRGYMEQTASERRSEKALPMARRVIQGIADAAGIAIDARLVTIGWEPWTSNRSPDEETNWLSSWCAAVTNSVREGVVEPTDAIPLYPEEWFGAIEDRTTWGTGDGDPGDDDDPPILPPAPDDDLA